MRRGIFNPRAARAERAKVQASRDRLEREHGSTLDSLTEAERDALARLAFGSMPAAELGRKHAPGMYRIGLLSALASGGAPDDGEDYGAPVEASQAAW